MAAPRRIVTALRRDGIATPAATINASSIATCLAFAYHSVEMDAAR